MKAAEKLKRIKLISEQIFIATSVDMLKNSHASPSLCINGAEYFVTEFEKFETEFLKQHEVEE